MNAPAPHGGMDIDGLKQDLDALGRRLRSEVGDEDARHLRKIAGWGRALTVLGVATAWIAPNPVSIVALSTGRVARWAMIGHHVCHRGYDRVGMSGRSFGEGWSRAWEWLDWLVPAAWKHEHNVLHHYRLNETRDPDLVEDNLQWLRDARWPVAAKVAVVAFFAFTWRFTYYAPNTLAELHRKGQPDDDDGARTKMSWDPRTPLGRAVWLRSVLPFAAVHFVLWPLLFAPLSAWAAFSVLFNSLLAEALANLHSFAIIVPNHVGGDLYRFDAPGKGKRDFYLRQVIGSVNYRTGGDLNDFLHGFLNYQIEHHLWPDLPMRAYQRAQPEVARICAARGVSYVQESVWRRVFRTVRVMVGLESMRRWDAKVDGPTAQ